MNKTVLSLLWMALCFLHSLPLGAQAPSPHWAKQVYGTKWTANFSNGQPHLATDRQGNVYALFRGGGYFYADGQLTPDSTATAALVSWDCNGNLRWMKSFGSTTSLFSNYGTCLATDTSGGVYVAGAVGNTSQSSGSAYWDTDTTLNIAAGNPICFLIKYNSQGQFQWFRTPVNNNKHIDNYDNVNLSVGPAGEVFWIALLDTGTYNGGAFTITARKYYAVNYDAAGAYQAAIPLDMTPPASTSSYGFVFWRFDPSANRFYGWLNYDTTYGSNLAMGNTAVALPSGTSNGTAVLGAFNRQGQNLWVRQASPSKTSLIGDLVPGKDGVLYLTGLSEAGTVFCGDTVKSNTSGQNNTIYIMAIDSNAQLLWSTYPNNSGLTSAGLIHVANNTVSLAGTYHNILSWGGHTITVPPNSFYPIGFLLLADASTGAIQQLDSIKSQFIIQPENTALDRNGNVYVSGIFSGDMVFGTDSLSAFYSSSSFTNAFLLKYKNAACGCNLPQPAFTVAHTAALTFQYTYTGSTPFTTLSWDFGDGSPTVPTTNPSHTYTTTGTFPVCVTVTDSCGSNTDCKYVTVSLTHVEDANVFSFLNIYPNPATEWLTISGLPTGATIEISDIWGRCLKKIKAEHSELQIPLYDLATGIHLIRITDKEDRSSKRTFLKQ